PRRRPQQSAHVWLSPGSRSPRSISNGCTRAARATGPCQIMSAASNRPEAERVLCFSPTSSGVKHLEQRARPLGGVPSHFAKRGGQLWAPFPVFDYSELR